MGTKACASGWLSPCAPSGRLRGVRVACGSRLEIARSLGDSQSYAGMSGALPDASDSPHLRQYPETNPPNLHQARLSSSRPRIPRGTRALIALARAKYSMTPPGAVGSSARTARISRVRSLLVMDAMIFVVGL